MIDTIRSKILMFWRIRDKQICSNRDCRNWRNGVMRKSTLILLGLLFVSGCGRPINRLHVDKNRQREIDINRQNLKKLQVGMSKQEVITIMGEKSAGSATSGDGTLKILYYRTNIKSDGKGITSAEAFAAEIKDQLTPVVFENGRLTGWGWRFVGSNIDKHDQP